MAIQVQISDTFDFWRQQFNALINETNAANNLFVTPQSFGAIGDGIANDTSAFNLAQASGKPVYVPPGSYKVDNIYGVLNPVTGEISSNFFAFGGVQWVNGFSGFAWFKFDLMSGSGPKFSTVRVTTKTPTSDDHLTSKMYVDQKDSLLQSNITTVSDSLDTEKTDRLSSEVTINSRIDGVVQDVVDLEAYTNQNFFRKNQSNTATNGLYVFETLAGLTHATDASLFKGLEVRQNVSGSDAFMTFHVGNDFGAYFGISGSINDLAVGGFSYGTSALYRVLHEGNMDLFTTNGRQTSSGSWFNNGFLKISTDGRVESGRYLSMRASGVTGSADAEILVDNVSGKRYFNLYSPATSTGATFSVNVTDGITSLVSKSAAGIPSLALSSDALNSVDPLFPNSKTYLYTTMLDAQGGARIRAHYHNGNNINSPAMLLEGIKKDDGHINTEWAVVSTNAFDLSSPTTGIGCNDHDNIFGSYNNGSARFVVKGDGRVYAPNCDSTKISNSSQGNILTTRDYVLDVINYLNGLGFAKVLTGESGYQKIWGGLIIQWGSVTSSTDAAQTFTFPTNFTSACYTVVTNRKQSNSSLAVPAVSWTTNGFVIDRQSDVSGSFVVTYIAIGV